MLVEPEVPLTMVLRRGWPVSLKRGECIPLTGWPGSPKSGERIPLTGWPVSLKRAHGVAFTREEGVTLLKPEEVKVEGLPSVFIADTAALKDLGLPEKNRV